MREEAVGHAGGRGEGSSHESIGSIGHRKALEEFLVIRQTDIPLPSHPFNLVNIEKGKKAPVPSYNPKYSYSS